MSFGNYLHRDQKRSCEYAVSSAKAQVEERFKKNVFSNIKYLSALKEHKSKGTVLAVGT